MDEDFELLIDTLNISSKCPFNQPINVESESFKKCATLILKIKNDPETFGFLQDYYIYQYRLYLSSILKEFWADFSLNSSCYRERYQSQHRLIFEIFKKLSCKVYNWLQEKLIEILFDTNNEEQMLKLYEILYTLLIADMPSLFAIFLSNTFAFSFEIHDYYSANKMISDDEDFTPNCRVCHFKYNSNESCYCQTINIGFIEFIQALRKLGILNQLCNEIVKSVLFKLIEQRIYNHCKEKNFDVSCLSITCKWLENTIIDWLKIIYLIKSVDNNTNITMYEALEKFKKMKIEKCSMKNQENDVKACEVNDYSAIDNSLEIVDKICGLNMNMVRNFMTNTYIFNRMKQLFDIIIDFPYSRCTILDLRECIELEPFYREIFTQNLKNSLESRLLHAGVATSGIIEAYLTTLKALRLLDPQGIILQIVCEPVRNYLKTREDTVRCIINLLTADNLMNFDDSENFNNLINDDNESIMETWRTWAPQTIGVTKTSKEIAKADILSMLINIFDSKDLFVQEYQKLLAQKLITSTEINLELELRNLELLLLRFGESELHNCEVMLKDIKDSERINQQIHGYEEISSQQFKMNGLILSEQFWPENLGFTANDFKNFRVPKKVQKMFDNYKKIFETLKGNRTVNWIQQLGTVKLELEFNNGSQEFSVQPMQAAIIHLYQDKNRWSITEIAQELDVLPSMIRRHILYWKNIGILKEQDNFYTIVEDLPQQASLSSASSSMAAIKQTQEIDMMMFIDPDNTDDNEKVNVNSDNQKNENNLQIFWNFIDNMLKNLGASTLDRIYSMLKMFNIQSPEIENLSIHQLKEFLEMKIRENKLIFVDGCYNLNKESNE